MAPGDGHDPEGLANSIQQKGGNNVYKPEFLDAIDASEPWTSVWHSSRANTCAAKSLNNEVVQAWLGRDIQRAVHISLDSRIAETQHADSSRGSTRTDYSNDSPQPIISEPKRASDLPIIDASAGVDVPRRSQTASNPSTSGVPALTPRPLQVIDALRQSKPPSAPSNIC